MKKLKNYTLSIDLTVSFDIDVEAYDKEEAIRIARERVINAPQYYASKGLYVNDDIIEINVEHN